jgi:imidazole glycerol-phosphate synthase
VQSPQDILDAKKLLFPGVGSYGQAMGALKERGYVQPLTEYLRVCITELVWHRRGMYI